MTEYSINFDEYEAVILVDQSSTGNTNISDLIEWCLDNLSDYEVISGDGYSSAAFCFSDMSDAESFNEYRSKSYSINLNDNPFNHLNDIVFDDYIRIV
jgi:predicted ATP-binding protein involved in virulence